MSDISTIPFRIYLLAVVKGPKLEEPVLRSDYITYADTSDCLVYFSFPPITVAHVQYDLATC